MKETAILILQFLTILVIVPMVFKFWRSRGGVWNRVNEMNERKRERRRKRKDNKKKKK